MKKLLAITALLLVSILTTTASARVITRDGSDYNGYAATECGIFVHSNSPSELHVGCRNSDENARIRYRFLRDVDGQFAPADVDVAWERHGGDCSGVGVRWMVPTPRTVRVIVPAGCYAHILSVTWDQ